MKQTRLVPFDLEKATQGAKVVTRCGYPAEVKFHNVKVYPPIICLVEMEGKKKPYAYSLDGRVQYTESNEDNDLDIFIEEVKTRRMTQQELSWWLKEHPEEHREYLVEGANQIYNNYSYALDYSDKEVSESICIRKNGGEWEKPLIEVQM